VAVAVAVASEVEEIHGLVMIAGYENPQHGRGGRIESVTVRVSSGGSV
jgi:hypothetical protein